MTGLRRLHDVLLLLAALLAALVGLDRQSGLSPAKAAVHNGPQGRQQAGFSRVFMLIPDSLRLQTALDRSLMPALAELRAKGVSARLETVYEGYSEPAFRAMFTGTEQPRILNVVGNFYDVGLKVPSLFDQIAAAGLTAADYTGPHLMQFDPMLRRFFPPAPGESYEEADRRLVMAALSAFQAEQIDLAVVHLDSTDWVAHEGGVHTQRYREVYSHVDQLVRTLDAVLPPDVTLLVTGDHGHDESGAHKTGLDIPSAICLRGPDFNAGVDLGTVDVTEVRYLLSWALKLSVSSQAYDHARLRRALRDPDRWPAFASGMEAKAQGAFPLVTAVAVCVLVAAAWVAPSLGVLACLCAWLCAVSLAFGDDGAAVIAGVSALMPARLWVGAVAGALAGWGTLLSSATLQVSPGLLTFGWLAPMALALPFAHRRREQVLWTMAAVLALALEPALQLHGLPRQSTEVWVFLLWLALLPRERWREAPLPLLFAVAVLGRLLLSSTRNGVAPPTGMLELVPLAVIAMVAKTWLFGRFAETRGQRMLGAALALVLAGVQWIVLPKLLGVEAKWIDLTLGILLLAGRAGFRRRRPVAAMLELAILFLAYYDFVDNQTFQYAWIDCILAAFVVAGGVAETASDRALLLAIGLVLTFHVTVTWCVGGLEWHALYRWFDARLVEQHVGWFVPWILLKMLIPFWIVALLLAHAWGGFDALTLERLRLAASARACAFLAFTCGLAVARDAGAYLVFAESSMVSAVLFVAAACLSAVSEPPRTATAEETGGSSSG